VFQVLNQATPSPVESPLPWQELELGVDLVHGPENTPPIPWATPRSSDELGFGTPPKSFWAVVLAGGEGRRLRGAAGIDGEVQVPKQFRALDGSRSMLESTLERARGLVTRERILSVVTAEHRRWWRPLLAAYPSRNVVAQPCNRGTAAAVLLPLLTILRRDPRAGVMIFPSDHAVDDESLLRESVLGACTATLLDPRKIALVGVEPAGDTEDYGWLVPCRGSERRLADISEFAEKPDRDTVRSLLDQGALVNTLITVADGWTLLRLFEEVAGELVDAFEAHRRPDSVQRFDAEELFDVEELYDDLPMLDFSCDVLEKAIGRLVVCTAEAACGWMDVGTPRRLRAFLDHHEDSSFGFPKAVTS